MPLIDLSAPIRPDPPELPDCCAPTSPSTTTPRARPRSRRCSASGPSCCATARAGPPTRSRASARTTRTHVDAPWHYNSTIDGRRAQTIDELPLEWFLAPGVVIDATDRADGEALDRRRPRGARAARAGGARHRARAHRPRRVLRPARLHRPRPRRHRRRHALALRPRRARDGHRRLGLGRPAAPAGRAREGRAASGHLLGGAPVRPRVLADRAAREPRRAAADGFTVSCFPLRLVGGSAAPARVVAHVP